MKIRRNLNIIIVLWVLFFMLMMLGACRREETILPRANTQVGSSTTPTLQPYVSIEATKTEEAYPLPPYPLTTLISTLLPDTSVTIETTQTGGYPAPLITHTPLPTLTPTASETSLPQVPTSTATQTQVPTVPVSTPSATFDPGLIYPGPGTPYNPVPESTYSPPYPGPENTATLPAYPGPGDTLTPPSYSETITSTPHITQTPIKSMTASATATVGIQPSTTPTPGTGIPQFTPTEKAIRAPLSPPPAGSSVTIWHSWGMAESNALLEIIQSFKRMYPGVTISVQYIPEDDLYRSFYDAAYLGQGPSLLLGPSKWGPSLFDEKLIADLEPYVSVNFQESINPVALASGEYNESLISLPLSQHGLLLFRNNKLISKMVPNFDEFISASQQATHGGMVGSYLERGSYFSSPAIIGLGGQLMDENGYPAFNDQFGIEWFELLEAYDEAGAVTFNTNWDLEKFKQARVGYIIDGSWNISTLAEAIGTENLSIDPWPAYGAGHMSGWVETDNIFLNANTAGNNRYAALSFIGYLLDPNVQMRLAEVGHIPSVKSTQPRDPLIKQAMTAFLGGVQYPLTEDAELLQIYRNELDKAIRDVFDRGVKPETALQTAEQAIQNALNERESIP